MPREGGAEQRDPGAGVALDEVTLDARERGADRGAHRDALLLGAALALQDWMAALALVSLLYGGILAWRQRDLKTLVAYSSVSHLGFCTLGIFALNHAGIAGSIIQQINHGISTGALFLIVGFIYERRHTRLIADFGGISAKMPIFATIFMIITFSSIGLPGTNGFVGEFLILMGAFESGLRWYAVLGTTGVILAAVYMLWMFQRVMMGKITKPENEELEDLNAREIAVMVPLLVFVFWIGVYPNTFFDKMNPSLENLIKQVKGKQQIAMMVEAPTPSVAKVTVNE